MPAAGSGSRLGFSIPKALIEVAEKPLFVHSLLPFLSFSECTQVIIAAPANYLNHFKAEVKKHFSQPNILVVAGGETRQDSVGLALDCVTKKIDTVLVHDAARPFVTAELIKRVVNAVDNEIVAAVPGLQIHDTVKKTLSDSTIVETTLSRDGLYTIQTPQAIVYEIAKLGHQKAKAELFQGTDDVSLVERYHLGRVKIVHGDSANVKITTPSDYQRLLSILSPPV